MKKIVLLLAIILFSLNCAQARSFDFNSVKKLFNKTGAVQKTVSQKSHSGDSLTPSEQATIFYNDNDVKNALQTLLAIKENDRIAQDWLLLGNILQDQEKNSEAIFMYQRAVSVDPDFYRGYYNLGNMYLADDKPFMAIENYRKANKLNNEFPYAYYNLGCAYLKIGDLRKAKIAFLKAIELKNTEPDFHYNLAYTYKMLNKPKLAKQYLGFYNKIMENMNQ